MVNSDLPRFSQLQKRVNELESQEHIFPTPGNTIGMQQSLRKRLQYRNHELRSKSESFQQKRTVRIKVTGDGTQISRNLHTVVIAFAVIIDNEANHLHRVVTMFWLSLIFKRNMKRFVKA